jgi:hypothetical protein
MVRSSLVKSVCVAILLSGLSVPPAGAVVVHRGPAGGVHVHGGYGGYHGGANRGGYGYHRGYGYHGGYGYGAAAAVGAAALGAAAVGAAVAPHCWIDSYGNRVCN